MYKMPLPRMGSLLYVKRVERDLGGQRRSFHILERQGKPLKRCVGPVTREQIGDIRATVSSAFIPMFAIFLVVTSAVTGRSFSA